jgi:hypothetical protein
MKLSQNNRKSPAGQPGNIETGDKTGYPASPDGEDIYDKYKEEKEIDSEEISKLKDPNALDKTDADRENDFIIPETGSDLDVPGSELDDELENIGSEDEENNYYSLGSDDHTDLDESQGGMNG